MVGVNIYCKINVLPSYFLLTNLALEVFGLRVKFWWAICIIKRWRESGVALNLTLLRSK
jgi:hypothetical protein